MSFDFGATRRASSNAAALSAPPEQATTSGSFGGSPKSRQARSNRPARAAVAFSRSLLVARDFFSLLLALPVVLR
ncbi:MAG: hypothetical protein M3Z41_01910 [Candidatus Eremiobacteraeota bacterium]|nr:hypothetical protein [Candidatus Eremiobacteraeota bacterium]